MEPTFWVWGIRLCLRERLKWDPLFLSEALLHEETTSKHAPFPELSVVVMAYNEEACAAQTVNALRVWLSANVTDWELVFVDDGSEDGTAGLVEALAKGEPRIRICRHGSNLGMGAAILTGYTAASKNWVTQVPADGQVPPEIIGRLLGELPGVDMVLSVYEKRGDGLIRTLLSWGYATLGRLLLGRRSDFTGTMLLPAARVKALKLVSRTFLLNLEVPLKLIEAGCTFRILRFNPSPRLAGSSKVARARRIAAVFLEMLRLRVSWNADEQA